mmetsp:Transcript_36178/g.61685  ORF Transcript_36178/g.61685 Transcript_36178/m.61685 type:complete len:286 (-) Transcript_36178:313-1170(-)
MIGDEFTLGEGIVGTCIPGCWEFGFVLYGYSIEIDTMVGVCRNELAKKLSPTPRILGLLTDPIPNTNGQCTPRHIFCMQVISPFLIRLGRRLHPTGWTPRRGYNAHSILVGFGGVGFPRDFCGKEHHVDHAGFEIVGDFIVEIGEVEVVFGIVEGIGFDAEVAGVDVGTSETISQSIFTKQQFHRNPLSFLVQTIQIQCCRLSKRPAKSKDGFPCRIGHLAEIGLNNCRWTRVSPIIVMIVASSHSSHFRRVVIMVNASHLGPLLAGFSKAGLNDFDIVFSVYLA